MNILLSGDGHSDIHERACATALRALGHDVHESYWAPLFRSTVGIGRDDFHSVGARAQNKLVDGPLVRRYNADLVALARRVRPDVFIAYRGTHLLPATLAAIRAATGARLVSINNDDPFSPGASALQWRHFRAGLGEYDLHFVYRRRNIEEYLAHGARRARMLRSFYIPERNHPIRLDEAEREEWGSDVVFIGHFEDDGRLELLEAVAAAGYDLRLWGYGWEAPLKRSSALRRLPPAPYLDGQAYNRVLNASKIALCFLSKLNRDTYTRRCFEVPASGTFLLSEYSDDLATLFVEGVEAELFRDRDELLATIGHYLADDEARQAVAAAGRRRVVADGHDVVSRMAEALQAIEEVGVGASVESAT